MATGGVRVLVVDDDESIREFIVGVLEDEGYTVAAAADGLAALDQAAAQPPDVILLDWQMPRCGGPAFAARYRTGPGPHAPLVVMTAARHAEQRCAELRAEGCLPKPFDLDLLYATVERVARRAA